jgi:hypothetical protein
MTGFVSLTAVKTEIAKGHGQTILPFIKVLATGVISRGGATWDRAGTPAAGTNPTTGLAGAVVCNKTMVGLGGMQFDDAPAGQKNYLWKALFTRAAAAAMATLSGLALVVDRLAHANVSIVLGSGNFSPIIDGRARLAAGECGQIICEVTTALSAGVNTFTLTYTNENDVSHTTQVVTTVASAAIGTFPYATYFFVPLQAGDKGVRTITAWTLAGGTATGSINIAIVKPLLWIPHPFQSMMTERELSIQMQGLQVVDNAACLNMLFYFASTGTVPMMGELRLIKA